MDLPGTHTFEALIGIGQYYFRFGIGFSINIKYMRKIVYSYSILHANAVC